MIAELTRQELVKLLSQRYPYLMLALLLAVELVRMVSVHLAPAETSLDVVSGALLWAEGVGWALRLLVYLLLVVGAMALSREFSLGTAKTVLVQPVTRRQWFAAKLLMLLALAWGVLLLAGLLGLGAAAAMRGWGAVVADGQVIYTAAEVWRALGLTMGLTALLLAPLCAFALWVGLFFTSSGAAVGVAVLAGTLLELVAGAFDAGSYLFVAHLHRPVALLGRLGRGLPVDWQPVLAQGVPVGLVTFALFVAWGLWRLERMDIAH